MTLEFATTQELLEELMNRETFVGMIIHSEDENKSQSQVHENFRFYTTSDIQSTIVMLNTAIESLKQQNKG